MAVPKFKKQKKREVKTSRLMFVTVAHTVSLTIKTTVPVELRINFSLKKSKPRHHAWFDES
tara:strand:- start:2413 stop:2595 length:183 start_codon:yes stop_codon:yes gene_type:complete